MDTAPREYPGRSEPKPLFDGVRTRWHQSLVWGFALLPAIIVPVVAVKSWGWGTTWLNLGLAVLFYCIACLGVTVGYHRLFTHGAFKANRGLKIALAIAGSTALQGPVRTWVADHRRHHAFSDREGDPHSPWAYGTSPLAMFRGFWHAHMGWLMDRDKTNVERFAPDLAKDSDLERVDRLFWLWTLLSFLVPAALGGLLSWSWWGAVTALFWAGLVRMALLHHITWSTNSICHMIGERPFTARDKAANFWPLAIFSMGESWHNSHHADPTCARHGVLKGQIDISARLIWLFEKWGWATEVRWPRTDKLGKLITGKAKEKGRTIKV